MFDAIQLKRAAAQLKRAVEILAVDPKDYRALSVAARAMMDGKDDEHDITRQEEESSMVCV